MSSETSAKIEDLVTDKVQAYIETLIKELGITNHTTNISSGAVPGHNFLGIIAKVKVNGQDKSGENKVLHFIVKSAPRNEVFRMLSPVRNAYDREIYMYNKVFPEFTKLQEERGVLKPFKSTAKFYGSTMENMNEALILEDMNELGFEMHYRHEPLNYNQVLLIIKEYGKFHALSYALRDQKPELFQEIFDNTQESYHKFIQPEVYEKLVLNYHEKAINSLDPVKDKIAYDKFKKFKDDMCQIAKNAIQSEPAGRYAVIGHGDSWSNNMLFRYDSSLKSHSPPEVCLLDWQQARAGSPALDLAYFIFTCTDKPLRDQYYDHLIQEYYESLSSFLRELRSDPDKLFPFEVLQEHLKKFCVFGLFVAITILYGVISEAEELPDVNNMTGLEDLHIESKNVEWYNTRIREVILDFIKFGYEF